MTRKLFAGPACCGQRWPSVPGGPLVLACKLCPNSPTYWRHSPESGPAEPIDRVQTTGPIEPPSTGTPDTHGVGGTHGVAGAHGVDPEVLPVHEVPAAHDPQDGRGNGASRPGGVR